MREFGLKRKKELWKAESVLRSLRRRARNLQARPDEKSEKELIEKAVSLGLIKSSGKIEDILGIAISDILNRRLQSVVYRKGLASTIKEARQRIVHKHIIMENKKIRWPSLLVDVENEDKISIDPKIKGEGQ
ncbi:MAG: 30S ribosomal protein S4, partial [Candidatus Aenigmarchaeota archaeon]|nr:30S ribosomal protein S4 [Candidatus Aenigmarchaeota archaeon]